MGLRQRRARGQLKTAGEIRSLALVSEGQQLAVGFADGQVRLWPTDALSQSTAPDALPPLKEWKAHEKAVIAFAPFGPQLQQLVTAGADDRVRLWDLTTGQMIREHYFRSRPVAWQWTPVLDD